MDEYAVDLVAVGFQTGHRGQVWSVNANAASRAQVRVPLDADNTA